MMEFKINLQGDFNNAQILARLLLDFASDVDLCIDHYVVDGKSLFGVLSLNFNRDITVKINEKKAGETFRIRDLMKNYGFLVE